MSVSKSYLYNFSAAHIYETFFYNVCVAETTSFYFCHCFYKAFDNGQILKNSIIYEEKPSSEVICCSFDCRKQFILRRAQ